MTDAAHDTHRPAGDGSAGPPGDDPLPRRVPVFAVVGLALLMFSLDGTSVATALTTISGDLGADLAWTGWVVTVAAVGQITFVIFFLAPSFAPRPVRPATA